MDTRTVQRIRLPSAADPQAVDGAMRWAARLPGMIDVGFQPETGELIVTYDLRRTTLARVRQHLHRGGVVGEASFIERCNLLAIGQSEADWRRAANVPELPQFPEVPLVQLRKAGTGKTRVASPNWTGGGTTSAGRREDVDKSGRPLPNMLGHGVHYPQDGGGGRHISAPSALRPRSSRRRRARPLPPDPHAVRGWDRPLA